MTMPTKKERLTAYRSGITASAQMSRADMIKAGDKAVALAFALMKIADVDPRDAESLTDLVTPLYRHVTDFAKARNAHFKALETSQLSDAELQRDHDEKHPERAIGRVHRPVALLANKIVRRSRKAARR